MSLTWVDSLAILGVISALLVMMEVVRRIGRRYGLAPELQRKLIHVATGATALGFPLVFSSGLAVALVLGVGMLVMVGLRARKDLSGVLHDVNRESCGEIYLALAIGMLFFLSEDQPILYVLPLLIITLSDTASALVGTEYGRKRFTVEGGAKSVEGVVAFFIVSWLIGLICLLLLSEAGRLEAIILSLLLAAFCALVEADSWCGLDNLFVPATALLLLSEHLDTDAARLVLLAAFLTAALFGTHYLAPHFGLSAHSARAYAILLAARQTG